MTLCSIVVPVYQEAPVFALFLESLWSTIDRPSEVILVNDGSGPLVGEIIDSYARRSDDRISVKSTYSARPRGGATALNEGLKIVSGDSVVIADSDLILTVGWQGALLSALDDLSIGVAGARLLYPQTGGVQHCGLAFTDDIGRHLFLNADVRDTPAALFDVQAVIFALCAIPRRVVESTGPVDDGYFNAYEDLDYMMRIRAQELRVVVEPKATAYHWERSNGVNRSVNRKRNLGRFWRRWGNTIHNDLTSHLVPRLRALAGNEPMQGLDICRDRPDACQLWAAIGETIELCGIADYSYLSGKSDAIWLPQILGSDGWITNRRLLILVDNFVQLLDNHYWLEQRRRIRNDDIVVDLHANVVFIQRLFDSSWPGTKIR